MPQSVLLLVMPERTQQDEELSKLKDVLENERSGHITAKSLLQNKYNQIGKLKVSATPESSTNARLLRGRLCVSPASSIAAAATPPIPL